MNVYLVWKHDYNDSYIVGIFETEDAAKAFAGERDVEERAVWKLAPTPWTYWHVGAAVYPDGIVERWEQEHTAEGEVTMPLVDDHLNADGRVWDGHTQSHCGEHVSIFGTDLTGCVDARERAVAVALARQDGTCHAEHWPHTSLEGVDGVNVYETGMLRCRDRGEPEDREWECPHDWSEWSEPKPVAEGQTNTYRHCRKCLVGNVAWQGTPTLV